MRILLTFNEAYAPHAATVITGLLKHCSQSLTIYVLYLDLSEVSIKRLLDYYKDRVKLIFIKVDYPKEFVQYITNIEQKKEGPLKGKLDVYLRLFAPLYIWEDDVLYIDCDIVINGDVSKILSEVDKKKYISAVKEHDPLHKLSDFSKLDKYQYPQSLPLYVVKDAFFFRMKKKHGMNMDAPYFCAGVMYMNLKKMREDNFFDKVIKKLQERTDYAYADQDILNGLLNGDFGVLPPKWNSFVASTGILVGYSSVELKEAIESPVIVHMPGTNKPWNKKMTSKYHRMYWTYRKETPWPENFTYPLYMKLLDFVKRVMPKVKKEVGFPQDSVLLGAYSK